MALAPTLGALLVIVTLGVLLLVAPLMLGSTRNGSG